MARKQQRTKLKPFDIVAWIEMDRLRSEGKIEEAIKIRNTLVEQNRPYAVTVACDFQRRYAWSCDQQDLIQCACEGLTRAVWMFNPRLSKKYKFEEFDPSKGAFIGYAGRHVLAEQRKWSRRDRVIFKPLHEEVPKAVKQKYKEFVEKYKREPKKGELGVLNPGTTIAKIQRAQEPNPPVCSQDQTLMVDTREVTLHDILASPGPSPEDILIRRETEFREALALAELPRDEQLAVVGYVLEERSYTDVGLRLNPKRTTKEVQELVKAGLERLRPLMERVREG